MEQQHLEKAMQIYYFLLKEGELSFDNNKELYMAYSDSEIKSLVEVLARESEVTIEKYNQVVYLIPGEENDVIGVKDMELQKELASDARKVDFYISQYIIVMLITVFFSGKGNNIKSRDFIRVSDFEELISERLAFASSKADIGQEEQEARFNIVSIYEQWKALPIDDPFKRKTKYGYIRSVCGFMKEQNLVIFDSRDEDIRPTNKLTHLMSYNFLNKNRQETIDRLLGTGF